MDLKFLFYVFLSVVAISGVAFSSYQKGQFIGAGILFIGLLIASLFFGFRWFTSSGDRVKGEIGEWPPAINYCPDFLTLYKIDNTHVCIDTIGVAGAGGIHKWIDNSTTDNFKFNLSLDKTGKVRVDALCAEVIAKKVKWEGVSDGITCFGNTPPMPPA